MSLPSPVATSGWNSSVSSDFGATPMLSNELLSLGNPHHTSAFVPSYDSFDDPISGSRLPSLRSYINSDEDISLNGASFSKFNVAGSRRSIDFQSPQLHSSSNLCESNNAISRISTIEREKQTYASITNDSLANNRNLIDNQQSPHKYASPYVSSSVRSSIRSSISFSLPSTCNTIKR